MQCTEEKSGRELTSWKEIAEFLEVSVRTAQRYEVELGLPVRRLPGEKGRAVAADTGALAAWKRKQVATPPWWRHTVYLRRYSIAVTCLLVILTVYVGRDLRARFRIGKPRQSRWVGSTLVVSDERNREVWRKSFEGEVMNVAGGKLYHGDLDGDGSVESLVPHITRRSDTGGGYLYCYSEKGEERWRLEPKPAVSDPATKFSTIYVLGDYEIFPSPERDGTQWVIAAFGHHAEYPSVALLVDSQGKQRGQYWASGHIHDVHTMDLDGDGVEEILLAGTDKETNRAILRVFDPRKMAGAQVLPPGHPNQLLGFAPGTEKAVALFERSRLNRGPGQFNYAYWIWPVTNPADRSFQVSVCENLDETRGYLVYTIRPDLSLVSLFASGSLHGTYLEHSRKDPAYKPFGPSDLEGLKRGYTVQRGSIP